MAVVKGEVALDGRIKSVLAHFGDDAPDHHHGEAPPDVIAYVLGNRDEGQQQQEYIQAIASKDQLIHAGADQHWPQRPHRPNEQKTRQYQDDG